MLSRYTTSCFTAFALLLAGGCEVGPNYKQPEPAAGPAWSGLDAGAAGPGVSSTPTAAAADLAAWWGQFNDRTLTTLIERAVSDNLTLAQAETRIHQARAARDIAASGLYPTVDASFSAARSRSAAGQRNSFQAGFDAAWEIDVFGGTKRAVEAADADVQSAVLDSRSVRVSLAGEVATAYLDLRGAQHQLAIARQNLAAQQETLDLTQQRLDAGYVGSLDVANASAQTNQTASQIPAYDARIRTDVYTLDVLLGREPGSLLNELAPEPPALQPPATPNPPASPAAKSPADEPPTSPPIPPSLSPHPPAEVPIGLPSELLQRRPDVRRAEADLHAATARVGVAVADQYPRFSLTGALGVQGGKAASLGTLADHFWSIGPTITLPILAGGRTQAQVDQAKAVADEAMLAYRASLLTAIQDVDTALVNFTREQQRRAALEAAVASSRKAVDVALQLYSAGRTDFLNVLSAQGQLYSTESALSQSETAVGVDLVALYKALGGGWNPGDVPPAQHP